MLTVDLIELKKQLEFLETATNKFPKDSNEFKELEGLENFISSLITRLTITNQCFIETKVNSVTRTWPVVRKPKE